MAQSSFIHHKSLEARNDEYALLQFSTSYHYEALHAIITGTMGYDRIHTDLEHIQPSSPLDRSVTNDACKITGFQPQTSVQYTLSA